MSTETELVISTSRLTKSYNGTPVLRSLDLKVQKNSIFGFLGPNGAGKTTTIKLMLGLIRPTGGSCHIFGMGVDGQGMAIRRRIGYLPQEPRYYDYMTARQLLRFVADFFYAGPRQKIEERVEESLQLVGLADRADRPIKGFSGGERQRLGIAQAQINSPDLLIFDEPAASLDPLGRRDVLKIMERMRSKATIFYSTHILDDVQKVSDTVAILNKGELIAQAPVEKLLAGSGNLVYEITTMENTPGIRPALTALPWVTKVESVAVNGSTKWSVAVVDESAAENGLMKLFLENNATVKEFVRKKYDLEEIFVELVGGN